MTLEFFYNNYNLNEITISKVYVKENNLYLALNMSAHLDLIANGYRPALDININKTFIFCVNHKDINIKKTYNITKYEYKNKSLLIEINNILFTIEKALIAIQ